MHNVFVIATAERKRINIGSRSERDAVVVRMTDGHYATLSLNGANPFSGDELDKYVGQRVKIEGVYSPSSRTLFIRNAADISILGPQGRPSTPHP
jgi:hypothetical protein